MSDQKPETAADADLPEQKNFALKKALKVGTTTFDTLGLCEPEASAIAQFMKRSREADEISAAQRFIALTASLPDAGNGDVKFTEQDMGRLKSRDIFSMLEYLTAFMPAPPNPSSSASS